MLVVYLYLLLPYHTYLAFIGLGREGGRIPSGKKYPHPKPQQQPTTCNIIIVCHVCMTSPVSRTECIGIILSLVQILVL